jgi:hypothetical protein
MCFSQPKMPAMPEIPPPPPPPAPPPPPLAMAEKAPTQRATQPTKRRRGTAQVTARRRPSIGMGGGNGGTGVQLSS